MSCFRHIQEEVHEDPGQRDAVLMNRCPQNTLLPNLAVHLHSSLYKKRVENTQYVKILLERKRSVILPSMVNQIALMQILKLYDPELIMDLAEVILMSDIK